MPIIAESEPIPVTISVTPTGPPGAATPPPGIAPQIPISPPLVVTPTSVTDRHKQFIDKIDTVPSCFDNTAIVGFAGPEFDLHITLASIDKYVVDAGNGLYCSKNAVENLSKALQRIKT